MGSLAQNLQSNGDRLKELTLVYEQAAYNNRWGDMLAVLPQILDLITSTAIHLAIIEPEAVGAVTLALEANIKTLREALEPAVPEEEPSPKGQVSTEPTSVKG